jgi:hypothetical protein
MITNQHKCFLELVRAGLWEKDVELLKYGTTDFEEIMRLAEEQSVVGLVTAGLEHVTDMAVPKVELLQFIGQTLQIEEQNKAMNEFVTRLMDKLRKEDVCAILAKGQGVAQCYERPLWRASGDVDLLLGEKDYNTAKAVLVPIADDVAGENRATKHQAYVIKGFDVELHGRMPFGMSRRADKVIDEVIESSLCSHVNVNLNDNGEVWVPGADEHVILVFTHFLHHFFIEGVGLRQICDWCRLLWRYREELDLRLLESRIRRMGLMSEWKAFYNLASRYLGMPDLGSDLTIHDSRFDKKADRLMKLVLESGNFGHNKDLSYRTRYSGMTYKIVAALRRLRDFASLIPVFPLDAPKFFFTYLFNKAKS